MPRRLPVFIGESVYAKAMADGVERANVTRVCKTLARCLLCGGRGLAASNQRTFCSLVQRIAESDRGDALAAIIDVAVEYNHAAVAVGLALDLRLPAQAMAAVGGLEADAKVMTTAKGKLAGALALGARAGLRALLFSRADAAILAADGPWKKVAARKAALAEVLATATPLPPELVEAVLRMWYDGLGWTWIQRGCIDY